LQKLLLDIVPSMRTTGWPTVQHRIRAALAQVFAHAAYYRPGDFLREPTWHPSGSGLVKLQALEEVRSLRRTIFEGYLNHLRPKITEILSLCVRHKVDVVVFPEYSIPPELLPGLLRSAKTHHLCVVAGSHMVDKRHHSFHQKCGLPICSLPARGKTGRDVGKAVSPILLPDGTAAVSWKRHESDQEPELKIQRTRNCWIPVESRSGVRFQMGVHLCVDAIMDMSLDHDKGLPKILAVPSWSPKPDRYHHACANSVVNEVAVCYVNEAIAGHSRLYGYTDRDERSPFLEDDGYGTERLGRSEEAVLIVDVDLAGQHGTVGTAIVHRPVSVAAAVPIVHVGTDGHEVATAVQQITRRSMGSGAFQKHLNELMSSRPLPRLLEDKLKWLLSATSNSDEDLALYSEAIFMSGSSLPDLERDFLLLTRTILDPQAVNGPRHLLGDVAKVREFVNRHLDSYIPPT